MPSDQEEMPVIHIAGLVINIGGHLRLRCAWCGAVLDDVELVLTAVPIEQGGQPYPSWPEGGLVAVLGNARWTVENFTESTGLCASLDPAVTT